MNADMWRACRHVRPFDQHVCRSSRGSPVLPHPPSVRAAPWAIDDADTEHLAVCGFGIVHTFERAQKLFTSHVWGHPYFDVLRTMMCIALGILSTESKRRDSTLTAHHLYQHAVQSTRTIFLGETSGTLVTKGCSVGLHVYKMRHRFRAAPLRPARCT